jgi:hypothetical protein
MECDTDNMQKFTAMNEVRKRSKRMSTNYYLGESTPNREEGK